MNHSMKTKEYISDKNGLSKNELLSFDNDYYFVLLYSYFRRLPYK